MNAVEFTFVPVVAVVLSAVVAAWRPPGPGVVAGVQHLAAGVVFGAAAAEILPQVVHQGSPVATLSGGALGVALMLWLKSLEGKSESPIVLLSAIGIDILIDGLVLGLAFVAGARAGKLLTVALTLEVLFLGLTVASELGERYSKGKTIAITTAIALLLPLGALLASPVATLPPVVISGFLSFGLMALLYLVTEELLVEAHERPDTPLVTSMFFVGFLGLMVLEELVG